MNAIGRSEEEAEQMIAAGDMDSDGKMSFEEYKILVAPPESDPDAELRDV